MKFCTTNPTTGKKIAEYHLEDNDAVFRKLSFAEMRFQDWKKSNFSLRAQLLNNLAKQLEEKYKEYAKTITLEMGKVIRESEAEILKCATLCRYYAENCQKQLARLEIDADGLKHEVAYEPLGTILTIMPWNFPFWQALRFAVPAIAAGNVVVLKHSNIVAKCALQIEQLFCESDFPKHVFQTVITSHSTVEKLITDERVRGISFTGSTHVGEKIGKMGGENLKKMVLELGGSDPFIVLSDANLEKAAQAAVLGRLINAGQSCIAAKRFIVMKEVADEFIIKFTALMKEKVTGDPMDSKTDLGPLVDKQGIKEIEDQVKQALEEGAQLKCGSSTSNGPYFEPVVLTNIKRSMRVMKEEVFGPVAPVFVVESIQEAIEVANETEFGLGASIWSSNLECAKRVALEIEAGTVFINSIVKSDPRMPFGGTKRSGIGRELADFGLREFVNIKGYNIYSHIN